MKPNLAILLLLLPLSAGIEAKAASTAPHQPDTTEHNPAKTPANRLAAEVTEIAATTAISRKAQAKKITSAIRQAINAATEGITDPAERLKVALQLTTVAAKAAPQFAATITSAVAGLPSLAKIEGAIEQIKSAVSAGIESADEPGLANPAANPRPNSAHHEFGGPNKGDTIVSPSQ